MTESLPAEAWLPAYRTDRHRVPDRQRTGYLVRATALADLVPRNHIADRDGTVVAIAPAGSHT
ncbi:hypothetical protein [Nocardia nova]|uniref:hypothetical protein n=1 Tax=Nocardia nova TaxID=37330 RepID=UPI00340DD7F6